MNLIERIKLFLKRQERIRRLNKQGKRIKILGMAYPNRNRDIDAELDEIEFCFNEMEKINNGDHGVVDAIINLSEKGKENKRRTK